MLRKHLLASCAAGLAAVLVPVASASALPLGGSGGTVIQPPSTSSTASAQPAPFTVTIDSVVATLTVRWAGSPGDLSVRWGDGTTSRVTGSPTASLPGQPAPPPAGTFVFQHVYAAPSDGAAFTTRITVVTPNALEPKDITITPRYRVTQYTLYFSPLNHCDTALEEYTEWTVKRFDHGVNNGPPAKQWDFDRKTHVLGEVGDLPPAFQPLPGSAASFDVSVADAPRIAYQVIERDLLQNDLGNFATINMQPRLGIRSVVLKISDDGPDLNSSCRVEIHADIDVRLLTPGLPTGPVASP
jgi:hypothetical protein